VYWAQYRLMHFPIYHTFLCGKYVGLPTLVVAFLFLFFRNDVAMALHHDVITTCCVVNMEESTLVVALLFLFWNRGWP